MLDHDTYVRLCRARDYLAAHYTRRLTLAEAARVACLSPFHFHRLFSNAFGETPHDFLTRRRFRDAQHRLILDNEPVTKPASAWDTKAWAASVLASGAWWGALPRIIGATYGAFSQFRRCGGFRPFPTVLPSSMGSKNRKNEEAAGRGCLLP